MKDYCVGCPVLKASFFAALRPETKKLAVCLMAYGRYKKRQVIYQQGNPATRIFAIKSGLLKSYKARPNGRTQLITLYGPGSVFALESLASGEYDETVEVVADAELCFLEAARFKEMLEGNRALSFEVIQILSSALAASRDALLDSGTKSAAGRLAAFLLRLLPAPAGEGVLPLSRVEIGSLIGTSIETVSRQFRALREGRVIELRGQRLRVLDRRKLESLAA